MMIPTSYFSFFAHRIQENADLLLQFFDNLFKRDANATLPHQTPTLVQILWPAEKKIKDGLIKEFVKLSWKSVTIAIHDSSKVFQFKHFSSRF